MNNAILFGSEHGVLVTRIVPSHDTPTFEGDAITANEDEALVIEAYVSTLRDTFTRTGTPDGRRVTAYQDTLHTWLAADPRLASIRYDDETDVLTVTPTGAHTIEDALHAWNGARSAASSAWLSIQANEHPTAPVAFRTALVDWINDQS